MDRVENKTNQIKERIFLGVLSLSFYVIHGTVIISGGIYADLLWICHLASILIGIGFLFNIPVLFSVSVLWLGWGNIMWVLYLLEGGDFFPTSILTHILAFMVGIYGMFKTRIPKYSWFWAVAGMALVQQVTRMITAEGPNVNLAHRVHEGWEQIFPAYGFYVVVLLAGCGVTFFILQVVFKLIFQKIAVIDN